MIIMNIAINDNDISSTQLYGMITGDENLVTKLEGWEAFKNFFIKILNHLLPGVSIEDKEEKLRQLYHQIYPHQGIQTDVASPGSLEKTWQALENLIKLTGLENAHSMAFSPSSDSDRTKTLRVTIAGHKLPDIVLYNNPENTAIFERIKTIYGTPEDINGDNDAVVYQLHSDALVVSENQVSFNSVFKKAFNVASRLIKKSLRLKNLLKPLPSKILKDKSKS